ncbi:hypothetical protein ACOMHN_052492 [Nucella lapillus]
MSSDDSDREALDQDLPTAAQCEERCQRFADVTGTDTALAMFFLQDRAWNLDQALNAYFEQNGGTAQSTGAGPKVEGSAQASLQSDQQPREVKDKQKASQPAGTADPEPHRIRVLCWNIDGLEDAHLKQRTKAVIDTVKREKAEVVLLQEVVGPSEAMLREGLGGDYRVLLGGTVGREGYYTAVLLHKTRAMLDDVDILPFHSSMMARNLMVVNCCVKGVPMTVMTSHLESTRSHAAERKRQLQTAFKRMKDSPSDRTVLFGGDLNLRDKEDAPPDRTVLFGGDLNLRDKELEEIGGLPHGLTDMWEATGSRKEARYTWDTFRNDNLATETRWRSKLRFDRLYLQQRKSTSAAVKVVYFELVGLERLEGVKCFPSDHWGILTHLDILPSFDK